MTHATKITEVFLELGNDDHRKGTVRPSEWIAVLELSNGEIRHQPIGDEFEIANRTEAVSAIQWTLRN